MEQILDIACDNSYFLGEVFMRTTIVSAAIFSFLLVAGFYCRETPTDTNGKGDNLLTAEDVGVTDVVLRIHKPGGFTPRAVRLRRIESLHTGQPRDTVTVLNTVLTSPDTLIIDEGLLPKQTYQYMLDFQTGLFFSRRDGFPQQRGGVYITTMDTTSHSFSFEIDTLGDGNSSILYDVAFVNDTCVYAVGEIYKRDSTGNFEDQPYNVAKWNGTYWKLMKIALPLYNYDCTLAGYITSRINNIFIFSPDRILINATAIWTGDSLINLPCIPYDYVKGELLKVWGTSEHDFYVVGRNGTILHYYESTWQKLESGTALDIYDIFGKRDPNSNQVLIYAVGGKRYLNFDRIILQINDLQVMQMSNQGINSQIVGIWFKPKSRIYVVGDGIFSRHLMNSSEQWSGEPNQVTNFYTNAVRGNDINDVFVAGAYGELLHWNGMNWISMRANSGLLNGQYYSLAAKGSLVCAVGYDYPRAVVVVGKRKIGKNLR